MRILEGHSLYTNCISLSFSFLKTKIACASLFFETKFFTGLDITNQDKLAGQGVPGINLCLSQWLGLQTHSTMTDFICGSWGSNSGPYAPTTNTLLTEPPPQPLDTAHPRPKPHECYHFHK